MKKIGAWFRKMWLYLDTMLEKEARFWYINQPRWRAYTNLLINLVVPTAGWIVTTLWFARGKIFLPAFITIQMFIWLAEIKMVAIALKSWKINRDNNLIQFTVKDIGYNKYVLKTKWIFFNLLQLIALLVGAIVEWQVAMLRASKDTHLLIALLLIVIIMLLDIGKPKLPEEPKQSRDWFAVALWSSCIALFVGMLSVNLLRTIDLKPDAVVILFGLSITMMITGIVGIILALHFGDV